MYHIWGFLLQTLSVSMVILILLFVKYILKDKLSPRWQYAVWILLMLRILIPINVSSYILPKIPVWIEMIKGITEKQMHSAYTSVYQPIHLTHIVPIVTSKPTSITDWLFLIYIFGVIVSLLRYLVSYISLRIILLTSSANSTNTLASAYVNSKQKNDICDTSNLELRIHALCKKYHLSPCQTLSVNGISSAFLCGVFRPFLVVPKDIYIDDKILLHELLHLKYMDTIQNIGWCILRSLHWCNPLVQYAICHIENDMESLCDQRVLEHLEGEERREYGTILLNMANSKYARIPGTSSISNGGKNISRRIEAIVHFKKYPQGMTLVFVCMILLLFSPTIIGYAATYSKEDYYPSSKKEIEQTMAIARLNRCSTVAGALDTYAKGLMLKNSAYIASASSLEKHSKLEEMMYHPPIDDNYQNQYMGSPYYGAYTDTGLYMNYVQKFEGYHIYNLKQIDDKHYQGSMVFSVRVYTDETKEKWFEIPYDDNISDEPFLLNDALLILPVDIKYEDAWVVEEIGERSTYNGSILDMEMDSSTPYIKKYYAKGETGTITLTLRTQYSVNNTIHDNSVLSFMSSSRFDDSPKTDAVFDNYFSYSYSVYDSTSSERRPALTVGIETMEFTSENQTFTKNPTWYHEPGDSFSYSGGSNAGESWKFQEIDENWDGMLRDGGGGSSTIDKDTGLILLPPAYGARIYFDGQDIETLTLTEVME